MIPTTRVAQHKLSSRVLDTDVSLLFAESTTTSISSCTKFHRSSTSHEWCQAVIRKKDQAIVFSSSILDDEKIEAKGRLYLLF
ncbi:unnamed protein product [Urochloa humidicola]